MRVLFFTLAWVLQDATGCTLRNIMKAVLEIVYTKIAYNG